MAELRTEEARINARARKLDPDAFAADPTDRWMERRRIHAWTLASNEEICRGDPRIAAAVLYDGTRH